MKNVEEINIISNAKNDLIANGYSRKDKRKTEKSDKKDKDKDVKFRDVFLDVNEEEAKKGKWYQDNSKEEDEEENSEEETETEEEIDAVDEFTESNLTTSKAQRALMMERIKVVNINEDKGKEKKSFVDELKKQVFSNRDDDDDSR